MLTNEQVQERMNLMHDIGISEKERMYAKNSFQDTINDDIISLVDELSSAVFGWLMARDREETRRTQEKHLAARRKLIEKIKELRK